MININKVYKRYDEEPVIKGLDLEIDKGSVFGLIGPNGVGKTTLIKMLTGIFDVDQGTITIEGQPIFENPNVKTNMILIPDEPYFFGCQKLIDLAKLYQGIYPSYDMNYYNDLLKVFELDERKALRSFSKGMKKQALFIVAMAVKPELLILDELVDGIDPIKRRLMWSILMKDVESRNLTVLMASHNLKELESVCSHIGLIHEGLCIFSGSLETLREKECMSLEDIIVSKLGGESDEITKFLLQ